MSKYLLLTLAMGMILLTGCDKSSISRDYPIETEPPVINQPSPISTKQTNAGIQGIVVDENNDPVSGAVVSCGNGNAITNAAGTFLISDATVLEAAAVIKVKKPGYFNGVRTIVVTGKNQVQFVNIMLLPKKAAGSFDAAKGGTVNASNAQFTFGPGMVLDSKNQPFTGTVALVYASINPEHPHFASMLPGDLRGINDKNGEVGLQSFGMMAVELQGEAGEELHLNGQKEVEIKMTIPATLRTSAPATIPLWHFDEKDGLWKEEGSATKSGDSYVGKVKHFSYWNCDAQFPLVKFKVTLQDQFGAPLANTQVNLVRSNGSSGYGYTDLNGVTTGMIPANETLNLGLKNQCNEVFFTQKIGPYTKDADAGLITVTVPVSNLIHFSGNATTCDGTPVKNGVVAIFVDSIKYVGAIKDGSYKLSILRCTQNDVNASVTVTDLDNSKQASSNKTVSTGSYTINLSACDVAEYGSISINLSGKTYSLNSVADSLVLSNYSATSPFYFYFFKKTAPYSEDISWTLPSVDVGAKIAESFSLRLDNIYFYTNSGMTITISQTGGVGEYISGTFNGMVDDSSATPVAKLPITGTFKIKR